MRRTGVLVLFLLLLMTGYAQAATPSHVKEIYPEAFADLQEEEYHIPLYDDTLYVQDSNTAYILEKGGKYFAVDKEGREIFPPAYDNIHFYYDYGYDLSKKTEYVILNRREKLEEGSAEGEVYRHVSALGNIQGEALTPYVFDYIDYLAGDLVCGFISTEENYGQALYNIRKKELVFDNAMSGGKNYYIFPIGSHSAVFIEEEHRLMLFDASGTMVEDEQGALEMHRGSDDFGVFTWEDGRIEVVSEKEGVLQRGVYIEGDEVYGVYLESYIGIKRNGKLGFYDVSGKEILPVEYDRVFPINENAFIIYEGDGEKIYEKLMDAQGNILSEGYDEINPYTYVNDKLLARRILKDNTSAHYLLDSKGRAEEITFSGMGDWGIDYISWATHDKGATSIVAINDSGEMRNMNGLIAADGKWIVPPSLYEYLFPLYTKEGAVAYFAAYSSRYMGLGHMEKEDMEAGEEYIPNNIGDIIDSNGYVLLRNVRDVEDFDGKYFTLKKGFSKGVMDMDGNWLYEMKIFDQLEDE